jgi:hypothetical protein
MDTIPVDICYRPLRIAMAVHSSDRDSFRRAVRTNYAFWGGRFNPIVFADKAHEARALVEVFRADFIVPFGPSDEVKAFAKSFPHLISPLFTDDLFLSDRGRPGKSYILDVHNALVHWRDKPEWQPIKQGGFRRILWEDRDPLSDSLLVQYGAFPNAEDIGRDYGADLATGTTAIDEWLDPAMPIPTAVLEQASLGFLSRIGLSRHYTVHPGWQSSGFYIGDSANIDDLAAFWNLRAADVFLHLIDLAYFSRYEHLLPLLQSRLKKLIPERDPRLGLTYWGRKDSGFFEQLERYFGGSPRTHSFVTPEMWNGLNVRPPMMILGSAQSLGVLGSHDGLPRASFTLNNKPFNENIWFHTQHLVASLNFYGGSEEGATFRPPYVPELNEYLARKMYLHYNRLRVEPERIGIIIDAADHNVTLSAASTFGLIEKTFELAGLTSKISSSGLIARQLIARLGGIDGARVFKIPGVRKLLKTFGPNKSFTQNVALQIIGGTPRFEDHSHLYIEHRENRGPLTKEMVFGYLVEKGLFRTGLELNCPTCNLASWYPLDALGQLNTCELCGKTHDATRSMIGRQFQYRRTGVLGIERNSGGAVPVVLLLQQLLINLKGIRGDLIEAPSHDLVPKPGVDLPTCEVDFVVMRSQTYPDKAELIIGECKDEGVRIDERDIANLRRVADAIPKHRFDTFILLARLSPFTDEEIALAKSLNGPFHRRAILLSARELEPYYMMDRIKSELGRTMHIHSAEDLANLTSQMYFSQADA